MAPVRFRLPSSISTLRIATTKLSGSRDCTMRGLIVAFLLLFWSSPALPEVDRGAWVRTAQHAAQPESGGGGHALDSGPIDLEVTVEEDDGSAVPCRRADGVLGYYLCQAQATLFGS